MQVLFKTVKEYIMDIDKAKQEWIRSSDEVVSETAIDELGTIVVLTKSGDSETYNLYRFFLGGNQYQCSFDKRAMSLRGCIERLVYLVKEYA